MNESVLVEEQVDAGIDAAADDPQPVAQRVRVAPVGAADNESNCTRETDSKMCE